jgi:protein-arginine kinase activator protein McsA
LSNNSRVQEKGTNVKHPGKGKKKERKNLTEKINIALLQKKAIHKINYEAF